MIPPSDVPAAFNCNTLSAKLIVVESTVVWVPCTYKSPLIVALPLNVTLTPLAVNALLNEDEYEFNSATEVFKLAVVKFIFVIETPCESFVVFAVDADAINEPLTTPISVNWVYTEELNEFKFVIETPCESFVVLAVDAEAIKLPLTTPISVNLVLAEPLNNSKLVVSIIKLAVAVFKFVIDTPCESFVVLAADADVIKLPLTTPISVNLVLAEPLNDSKLAVSINKLAVAEFKLVIDTFDEPVAVSNAVNVAALNDFTTVVPSTNLIEPVEI